MENKNYDVTISLQRYDELLKLECLYCYLYDSIKRLLNISELNWNKKDLDFATDDVRNFVKRFDIDLYTKRVELLNKKENDENE